MSINLTFGTFPYTFVGADISHKTRFAFAARHTFLRALPFSSPVLAGLWAKGHALAVFFIEWTP